MARACVWPSLLSCNALFRQRRRSVGRHLHGFCSSPLLALSILIFRCSTDMERASHQHDLARYRIAIQFLSLAPCGRIHISHAHVQLTAAIHIVQAHAPVSSRQGFSSPPHMGTCIELHFPACCLYIQTLHYYWRLLCRFRIPLGHTWRNGLLSLDMLLSLSNYFFLGGDFIWKENKAVSVGCVLMYNEPRPPPSLCLLV